MHEAVDEVVSYFHGRWQVADHSILHMPMADIFDKPQTAPTPGSKTCLIQNCFAWCLEHHDISVEADGEEAVTTRFVGKDKHGKYSRMRRARDAAKM